MKTGIELIAQERQEQLTEHGITVERDVQENPSGELLSGAINLLHVNPYLNDFPGTWNILTCKKMLNKNRIEQLAIAGALVAAEIDRLIAIKK